MEARGSSARGSSAPGLKNEGREADADAEAWGCPPQPVQLPFTNESVLKWLVAPHDVDDFFSEFWERKPLHIPHHDAAYLKSIMTHEDLEDVLLNTAEDEIFGEILTFKNQQQVYYDNGMRAYLDGKNPLEKYSMQFFACSK